jgi:hypothetical protein
MVAKKASKKAATKVRATSGFDLSKLTGAHVMYAQPIWDAVARGNAAEMRQLATTARSYVKDLQAAINKLEGKNG